MSFWRRIARSRIALHPQLAPHFAAFSPRISQATALLQDPERRHEFRMGAVVLQASAASIGPVGTDVASDGSG